MIDFHKSRNAEITVAVMDIPISEARRFGVLEVDRDNRIVSFEEKPKAPRSIPGVPSRALISMGIYLFQTEALVREVIADTKLKDSSHDFGRDILPRLIREGQPVCAFPFQDWREEKGKYWRDVGTLEAYYEANMDLVSVTPQLDLYESTWPIRTYQPPLPPAKTVFRAPGRCGQVLDSLIGDGSIVSGAKVVHSIISAGVFIHSYSEVEDSVIMEGVDIGRHARIRRAIIDKHVKVPEGFRIGYNLDEDRKLFTVTDTGIVVVPERMVI